MLFRHHLNRTGHCYNRVPIITRRFPQASKLLCEGCRFSIWSLSPHTKPKPRRATIAKSGPWPKPRTLQIHFSHLFWCVAFGLCLRFRTLRFGLQRFALPYVKFKIWGGSCWGERVWLQGRVCVMFCNDVAGCHILVLHVCLSRSSEVAPLQHAVSTFLCPCHHVLWFSKTAFKP